MACMQCSANLCSSIKSMCESYSPFPSDSNNRSHRFLLLFLISDGTWKIPFCYRDLLWQSFPKYALHQHRLHDCPNREVFCPLGCRMYPFTVRACDVQHHVAYECPKRISHLRLDVTKPAQDGNSTCPRCHIRLKATDIENHMFYHCPLLTNHKGLGIMR